MVILCDPKIDVMKINAYICNKNIQKAIDYINNIGYNPTDVFIECFPLLESCNIIIHKDFIGIISNIHADTKSEMISYIKNKEYVSSPSLYCNDLLLSVIIDNDSSKLFTNSFNNIANIDKKFFICYNNKKSIIDGFINSIEITDTDIIGCILSNIGLVVNYSYSIGEDK